MNGRSALVITGVLWIAAASAWAHRLDAAYDPQTGRIEFFYGDGSPAVELDVTATHESGGVTTLGRTDEAGSVTFRPTEPGRWTVIGQAAGHSNSQHPLVIDNGPTSTPSPAVRAAEPAPASQPAVTQLSPPPAARTRARGAFPMFEMIIGLSFVAVLTIVTLLMMRRAARIGHGHSHGDLAHELAHVRAELQEIRRELDRLRERRDAGA